MSVQDNAIKVLQSNRRLKNSVLKTKSYWVNNTKRKYKSYSEYRVDEFDHDKAKKHRQFISLVLCGSILLASLILFLGLTIIDKQVGSVINSYFDKGTSKSELVSLYEIRSYNAFVGSGNNYFERGLIDMAYENFIAAKNIKPTGKRANLGLTICLFLKCKVDGLNCDLAKNYYNLLITSNTLTDIEKVKLDSFR